MRSAGHELVGIRLSSKLVVKAHHISRKLCICIVRVNVVMLLVKMAMVLGMEMAISLQIGIDVLQFGVELHLRHVNVRAVLESLAGRHATVPVKRAGTSARLRSRWRWVRLPVGHF